ncbi:hypothetical protein NDU88_003944 [Pleurodeles waltl]|uniref:Uncharacterized protein n=1 Tax=Pleurodeles waltl TaxID=8319 RepID=A0AAV7N022_PLEWA|nr:hypothetical protein NDU88_003944 [Pleurodeles waltl]
MQRSAIPQDYSEALPLCGCSALRGPSSIAPGTPSPTSGLCRRSVPGCLAGLGAQACVTHSVERAPSGLGGPPDQARPRRKLEEPPEERGSSRLPRKRRRASPISGVSPGAAAPSWTHIRDRGTLKERWRARSHSAPSSASVQCGGTEVSERVPGTALAP